MKLRVVALFCCVLTLCIALAGCAGVDKSRYVGEWTYSSSENADLDEQSLSLADSLGLKIELVLSEDGTGTFTMLADSKSVTWDASSDTEGKLAIDGSGEAKMQLDEAGEELSLVDPDQGALKFRRP